MYKINEVPIFEQRRFLSNIDEKYRLVSKHTEQQEILRKKFENLVNSLLNDDLNSNKNNISGSLATDTISAVTQITNPIHSQSKSNKKNRKKGDENVLSSSVFEIEIDESDNSNDEDSDHESQGSGEESLDKIEQPQQKLIERKLNSNVAEIRILGGDVLKTNRVNFSKPNPFTNSRKFNFKRLRIIYDYFIFKINLFFSISCLKRHEYHYAFNNNVVHYVKMFSNMVFL